MNIYILNSTIVGMLATQILAEKFPIEGIITLDPSIGDRNTNEYYDYFEFCEERNIKYIPVYSYSLDSEMDRLKIMENDIDLIIVTSWQRIVPKWLINYCHIGVIGAHGSPEGITKGRGRSPQNWALILGEAKFQLSIFWIDQGIDSGDIIETTAIQLTKLDDIYTSYLKVNLAIAEMIVTNIENENIFKRNGRKQVTEEACYLPQRIPADGQIDWNRKMEEIHNFIRALTIPYPGAFTNIDGEKVVIWRARPIEYGGELFCKYEVGTILFIEGIKLLVKCKNGLILVEDYDCSSSLEVGDKFESVSYRNQIKNIVDRHNKKCGSKVSNIILKEL